VWSEADYTGMAGYLDHVDWNHLFSHNLTADAMWAEFHSVILNAIDCYVPSKIHLEPRNKIRARRYPKALRKAVARKRCLWRKYRTEKPMINSHLHIRML
jgi:hypothetical protein